MPDEIFISKTDGLLLLDALDWASDAMAHSPDHEQQACQRAVDQAWILLGNYVRASTARASTHPAKSLRTALRERSPAWRSPKN